MPKVINKHWNRLHIEKLLQVETNYKFREKLIARHLELVNVSPKVRYLEHQKAARLKRQEINKNQDNFKRYGVPAYEKE